MSDRRPVRVDPRFLEQLDAQLDEERGPNGEPSQIDFLRFELPAINDEFARRFGHRPIIGQLAADGSVLLLGVELDLGRGW